MYCYHVYIIPDCPYIHSSTQMGHIVERESEIYNFILVDSDVGLGSVV